MADDDHGAVAFARNWRALYSKRPRDVVRAAAIGASSAIWQWSGRTAAMLRRPRTHILVLHHVFGDEEANFRTLLKHLKRDHDFVSYGDAVAMASRGIGAGRGTKASRHQGSEASRPCIAFTFDDGFKNCMRAAAILEEFGTRACFFICPAILSERDPQVIAAFCRDRLELSQAVELMDWSDAQRLHDAGHEIGGHTMTHPWLTEIPLDEARDEISGSFEAIRSRLGSPPRHFAWTFGSFSACNGEIVRAAFDAGFETCASGERGCHPPSQTQSPLPLCIRRDHIIAGERLRESLFWIARSSARMTAPNGEWPAEWRPAIQGLEPHR